MQRASLERERTLRTWLRYLRRYAGRERALLRPSDMQPGRFRKGRRVYGCMRPRCMLCNPTKVLRLPHAHVVRHDAVYREMLEELGLDSMFRWRRVRRMDA